MEKIHPIILCGGEGTRLWPLSRKSYPKQFSLKIEGRSLFHQTLKRFDHDLFAPPQIMTSEGYKFIAGEQIEGSGLSDAKLIVEPDKKGTAAAVLAAAFMVRETAGDDAILLVAPSDHLVPDQKLFVQIAQVAARRAVDNHLVTIGIKPWRPETGYGWLELTADPEHGSPQELRNFHEKPDVALAEKFLSSGQYLWNSGIFAFTAGAVLRAFETIMPEFYEHGEVSVATRKKDLNFERLGSESWRNLSDESFDKAIMEKAPNLAVVPFFGEWTDLGSWDAVHRQNQHLSEHQSPDARVTSIDCKKTLLRSESNKQEIVGIGLRNIVAVAMSDAVLIADLSRSQEVGNAVAMLKNKGRHQATSFPRDHRPWGWFETLSLGDRFQVKQIIVRPGAALSLQSHLHRAEHWIVVHGSALVTKDNRQQLIFENQSIYIPTGARHRLENPGKIELRLIEVQTGGYLGEDDITRYDDVYARV